MGVGDQTKSEQASFYDVISIVSKQTLEGRVWVKNWKILGVRSQVKQKIYTYNNTRCNKIKIKSTIKLEINWVRGEN